MARISKRNSLEWDHEKVRTVKRNIATNNYMRFLSEK